MSVIRSINKVSVLFIFSTAMMMVYSSASAADDKAIAHCAAIENSANRLQCYDDMAHRLKLDEPTVKTSQGEGRWQVRTETSKIDDSKNVYVSVEADKPISGWMETYLPELVIRCREGKTESYIITGMAGQISEVSYGTTITEVTFRIDKQKAFSRRLSESTDNKAVFVEDAKTFSKMMFGHHELLFQFIPFNSSGTITTFQIDSLQKAIEPLRHACKW